MSDALFLTCIGMGSVFLFLILVMFLILGMTRIFPEKKGIKAALFAGAVAVALHENGGENG